MLILASNSPRRRQLITLAGWDFVLAPAAVDEQVLPGESPAAYVRRLAQAKADAAWRRLGLSALATLIVAADTAVVDLEVEDQSEQVYPDGHIHYTILGKPVDIQQAEAMLRRLRGRMHQVFTAVTVLRPQDGKLISDICISDVYMRSYSDAEMMAYIATGDPMDKAGAYAIQHSDFRPVARVQDCYANVVGLPLCYLARILVHFGVSSPSDLAEACQRALQHPCSIARRILDGPYSAI